MVLLSLALLSTVTPKIVLQAATTNSSQGQTGQDPGIFGAAVLVGIATVLLLVIVFFVVRWVMKKPTTNADAVI